mgnify:CR=1 FL=1
MIDNIELFNECKNNKEYVDKYYEKSVKPIITDSPDNRNKLMEANIALLENISTFKVALESKNEEMQKTALQNIVEALEVQGINCSEFASYWAVKDMSYSAFNSKQSVQNFKIEFIKDILPKYIKDRHSLYQKHGYTFSSLQVVKDSKAHKGTGAQASRKIQDIVESYGFSKFTSGDIQLFDTSDKVFIFPDKGDGNLFNRIIEEYGIQFQWSKNRQNKQTDCLFKVADKLFIMEHKHMKESGGGQDKQMKELIDFIAYDDENVNYISFLDGVYFNLLVEESIVSGKVYEQRMSILENLRSHKSNYFVNTHGFKALLESLRVS